MTDVIVRAISNLVPVFLTAPATYPAPPSLPADIRSVHGNSPPASPGHPLPVNPCLPSSSPPSMSPAKPSTAPDSPPPSSTSSPSSLAVCVKLPRTVSDPHPGSHILPDRCPSHTHTRRPASRRPQARRARIPHCLRTTCRTCY